MARYSDAFLEHALSPRNAGRLELANSIGLADLSGSAPRVQIYLSIEDKTVRRASFCAFGCGAVIACGSALTELITGRTIEHCCQTTAQDVARVLDGIPADKEFCAQLVVCAMRRAISAYRQEFAQGS